MAKCTQCMRGDCCGGDFEELEATIAELREAARAAVDAVRFQKPEHERAAIDALAALIKDGGYGWHNCQYDDGICLKCHKEEKNDV